MRTLMSGGAWVHYGQLYVVSGSDAEVDLNESFGGQRNGLCGAAVPGVLYLITGLHTGEVGFAAELHDAAPPVDPAWEEVVEASFRPAGETSLLTWSGEDEWPLDLRPGADYRVRYCAAGMDAAHEQDTRMDDEPEVDRYLLQFWPAPPAPDAVVRQASGTAAYWHGVARELPPPPSPEEKAARREAAEREERRARKRAEKQARRDEELADWGGVLPGPRLRALRGNALSVAELDRALVDDLAERDPDTQRAVARWVTRRAYREARLDEVAWIAPALAAMDRGEPLPPPFDGTGDEDDDYDRRAWDRLFEDPDVPHTLVASLDGRHDNCLQQAMAYPALFSAREDDPLRAAVDALWAAAVAFGPAAYPVLFAEVRDAFLRP